jgi:hypothetical protein
LFQSLLLPDDDECSDNESRTNTGRGINLSREGPSDLFHRSLLRDEDEFSIYESTTNRRSIDILTAVPPVLLNAMLWGEPDECSINGLKADMESTNSTGFPRNSLSELLLGDEVESSSSESTMIGQQHESNTEARSIAPLDEPDDP